MSKGYREILDRWDRKDLALGGFMGAVNIMVTLTVVAGVAELSPAVFFPTVQCSFLLGTAIISRFAWGERLTRRQLAGLAVALAIVVLANVQAQPT